MNTSAAPMTDEEWEQLRTESRQAFPENLDTELGLPAVLLSYQARLLQTTATYQFTVCEKSRRIGMTWAVGADAVLTSGASRAAGGMDTLYLGFNLDMAREFIDTCAMWAKAFMPAASSVQEYLFEDREPGKEDRHINAFRIRFASGFEIIALTSKPRSLRGRQGYVIFDEAAFHDELDEMIKSAGALLMWGGKILVISTHDGDSNPFNVLVRKVNAGEKGDTATVVRVDFNQAVADGLYERIALVTGQPDTPEAKQKWIESIHAVYGDDVDEELHCIPKSGSGAWLPAPLIEARMTADAEVLRLELPENYLHLTPQHQSEHMRPFMRDLDRVLSGLDLAPHYAAGFDFGRVSDLSVLPLLMIEQNLRRREAMSLEMRNVPGSEQKSIVGDVLDAVLSRLLGAAFDATGMGWIVAEDMGRRFGLRENEKTPGLIWAIKFTQEWYRVNMPPLKTAFETDMISIGADADHLTDLRAIKEIRGIPKVPDVRDRELAKSKGSKGGKKRHGDYGIGLALAHFASRMRFVEYGYRAAKAPKAASAPAKTSADRLARNRLADTPTNPWRGPLGARIKGGF